MKKYIYPIVLGISMLTVFSCGEDFLDLKVKNFQNPDTYYKNEADAIAATNSCYDILKGRGLFGQLFQYFYYAADDRLAFETPYMDLMLYNATDRQIGGGSIDFALWDYLYRGVFRCNMALERIPGIEMNSESPEGYDLKQRLLGEVRFMRGIYNFYLVIMFNEPPLILKVLRDPSEIHGNNTQAEFWAQIESDLTFAISVLPEKSEYPDSEMGRATKGAAKAMLGKAYLYQQKWAEAKQYLGEVIASGEYALSLPASNDSADLVSAFHCNFVPKNISTSNHSYMSENNSESVFEIQNSDNTELGFVNGEWSPGYGSDGSLLSMWYGVNGWKNVTPTASSTLIFEDLASDHPSGLLKDARYYVSIFAPGDILSKDPASKYYNKAFDPKLHSSAAVQEGFGIKKYYFPIHESVPAAPYYDPNNWRLIRYSDILLMYAEAIYHLGEDPFPYINQVRARAGLPATALSMPEALIHERDVEFYGECLRYHDLVRWSLIKPENGGPWVNPEEIIPNYKKGKNEYLPIPQSEIDNNRGALKQNPGW